MAVMKQTGQDYGAESKATRSVQAPEVVLLTCKDVYTSPLQAVAAGILNGLPPMQFLNGINAANQALGNRAFLQWVRALDAGRQTGAAMVRGVCGPVRPVAAAPVTECAPLQLMGKKKKQQGAAVGAGSGVKAAGGGAGAGRDEAQAPVAAQSDASGTLLPPGEAEPKPVEKKKKKKSRVQVALNALRGEGVAAFGRYIEAEIGETELLRTLMERIMRAENLAGVRKEALGVVEARLRLLDPLLPAPAGPVPLLSRGAGSRESREINIAEAAVAKAGGQKPELAVIAPAKSDLNPRDKLLIACCVKGDVGRLKSLLNHRNADVNLADKNGTLLCYATIRGHEDVVRELLSRSGIDVNLAGLGAATPLYLAVQEEFDEVVKLLLGAHDINVNLASITGTTPLCVAVHKRNLKVVELLLNAPDIRVNARKLNGVTALFFAAQENYTEIVDLLIKHGADVNLTFDLKDSSPLCIASKHGHIEVIKLLLEAPGVQINQTTDEGATALGIAAKNGHDDIVRLLLRYGADPNIKGRTGITPVYAACLLGHAGIVRMLLDSGADMDVKLTIPHGRDVSLYSLAQLAGHRELMSILLAQRRRREQGPLWAGSRKIPSSAPPEPESVPDTSAGKPAQQLSLTSPKQAGSPAHVDIKPAESQVTGDREKSVEATAQVSPIPPTPALPGEEKALSALAQAQDALRQEVLGKLRADNFDTLEGIHLLEDINATDSLDALCSLYNRLAHIERYQERARRRGRYRRELPIAVEPVATGAAAPEFALAGNTGLDAERVEVEIKRRLGQKYHRFVSQAVNDMEFGRGKSTAGHRALWHVSAGIPGVGSCSVFYYLDAARNRIRIVGIGHHEGRAAYQLDYAAEELGDVGRILRIA